MITECFDRGTEPVILPEMIYGERRYLAKTCLIMFSCRLQAYLLENFACEQIAAVASCNGDIPVYAVEHHGKKIAFYLSPVGSAAASGVCLEVNWLTGAEQFVMFGSCGSLDREQTFGKFIIPTESWRGEGASYYYAPPADFIALKNSDKTAAWFAEKGIPHVQGRIWTTDSMIRETKGLVAKRRADGCIAVEMEVAGVEAACDFYGLSLYSFLEAGDVLAESGYDHSGLYQANHDTAKLMIALDLAADL